MNLVSCSCSPSLRSDVNPKLYRIVPEVAAGISNNSGPSSSSSSSGVVGHYASAARGLAGSEMYDPRPPGFPSRRRGSASSLSQEFQRCSFMDEVGFGLRESAIRANVCADPSSSSKRGAIMNDSTSLSTEHDFTGLDLLPSDWRQLSRLSVNNRPPTNKGGRFTPGSLSPVNTLSPVTTFSSAPECCYLQPVGIGLDENSNVEGSLLLFPKIGQARSLLQFDYHPGLSSKSQASDRRWASPSAVVARGASFTSGGSPSNMQPSRAKALQVCCETADRFLLESPSRKNRYDGGAVAVAAAGISGSSLPSVSETNIVGRRKGSFDQEGDQRSAAAPKPETATADGSPLLQQLLESLGDPARNSGRVSPSTSGRPMSPDKRRFEGCVGLQRPVMGDSFFFADGGRSQLPSAAKADDRSALSNAVVNALGLSLRQKDELSRSAPVAARAAKGVNSSSGSVRETGAPRSLSPEDQRRQQQIRKEDHLLCLTAESHDQLEARMRVNWSRNNHFAGNVIMAENVGSPAHQQGGGRSPLGRSDKRVETAASANAGAGFPELDRVGGPPPAGEPAPIGSDFGGGHWHSPHTDQFSAGEAIEGRGARAKMMSGVEPPTTTTSSCLLPLGGGGPGMSPSNRGGLSLPTEEVVVYEGGGGGSLMMSGNLSLGDLKVGDMKLRDVKMAGIPPEILSVPLFAALAVLSSSNSVSRTQSTAISTMDERSTGCNNSLKALSSMEGCLSSSSPMAATAASRTITHPHSGGSLTPSLDNFLSSPKDSIQTRRVRPATTTDIAKPPGLSFESSGGGVPTEKGGPSSLIEAGSIYEEKIRSHMLYPNLNDSLVGQSWMTSSSQGSIANRSDAFSSSRGACEGGTFLDNLLANFSHHRVRIRHRPQGRANNNNNAPLLLRDDSAGENIAPTVGCSRFNSGGVPSRDAQNIFTKPALPSPSSSPNRFKPRESLLRATQSRPTTEPTGGHENNHFKLQSSPQSATMPPREPFVPDRQRSLPLQTSESPPPSHHRDLGTESAVSRMAARSEVPAFPGGESVRTSAETSCAHEAILMSCQQLVIMATDPVGSAMLIEYLKRCSPQEAAGIIAKLVPHVKSLGQDQHGSQVVHHLLLIGSPTERSSITKEMLGETLRFALHVNGCRLLQRSLEIGTNEERLELSACLQPHLMRCVEDPNGNHVIKKCIEALPNVDFIIEAFEGQATRISLYCYGCRVVQKLVQKYGKSPKMSVTLDGLIQHLPDLIKDQYGNYVVQYVIKYGRPEDRIAVASEVASNLLRFSSHKFASNVVEKCLEGEPSLLQDDDDEVFGGGGAGDLWRLPTDTPRQMLVPAEESDSPPTPRSEAEEKLREYCRDIVIAAALERGEPGGMPPILAMVRDRYANYVVQKMLKESSGEMRNALVSCLEGYLPMLKKFTYGKHIVGPLERARRAPQKNDESGGKLDHRELSPRSGAASSAAATGGDVTATQKAANKTAEMNEVSKKKNNQVRRRLPNGRFISCRNVSKDPYLTNEIPIDEMIEAEMLFSQPANGNNNIMMRNQRHRHPVSSLSPVNSNSRGGGGGGFNCESASNYSNDRFELHSRHMADAYLNNNTLSGDGGGNNSRPRSPAESNAGNNEMFDSGHTCSHRRLTVPPSINLYLYPGRHL